MQEVRDTVSFVLQAIGVKKDVWDMGHQIFDIPASKTLKLLEPLESKLQQWSKIMLKPFFL